MGHKLENVEKNTVKLTIEVSEKEFDSALSQAYIKNVKRFNVPGFRKGKAPKKMIEKIYGEGVFYEEAVNIIIPDAYDNAVEETKIHPVDQPVIDIVSIEAGKPFVFTATVTVKPEVELGEYKGVTVEKVSYPVTDKDVEAELSKLLDKNARIVPVEGRAAKDGDMTVIDFEGFIGDKAFEGGKGTDYSLTLGSGAFIPGFEKQIEGKNVGETFDVSVTFPEDYHAEELKGQDAVFKVTLKDLKEKQMPALDDEFAKDASEFETLQELKDDILAKLTEAAQAQEKRQLENLVLIAVTENAKMDVPECMVNNQVEKMVQDYDYRLRSQGIPLEQYLRYTGQTIDQLKEQMKETAAAQVRTDLVLDKIAEVEKISATDKDVDAELEKMAEQYSMELDKVKELMAANLENLKYELTMRKVIDLVVAEAKQTAKKPAAKKATTKKAEETTEEKKPAAKKPAAKSTTAAKKTTTKKTADAQEEKPAAKKPAAKSTTTAKKSAAKKPAAKKEETK